MSGVTPELLLRELHQLQRQFGRVEEAMQSVRVETQRCLWEAHYGREQIDRSPRAFEAQIAVRRERDESNAKGPALS